MNGEEIKQLNTTLVDLRISVAQAITKQDERHRENTEKFDTIFEKLDRVGDVNGLRKEIDWLKWVIFGVIILGIFIKSGV